MRPPLKAWLVLCASATLLAVATVAGAQSQGVPEAPPAPPSGPPNSVVEVDRNVDSVADYRVIYDRAGMLAEEDMDFNFDGKMDTFYYYKSGVLVREEIDTNFDGKVDLWIYIVDGKYVQRYEQDTDGDGKPDRVRNF